MFAQLVKASLLGTLAVMLAGCHDATAPIPSWAIGTWTLTTVDNVALPASIVVNGYQTKVVARRMVVTAIDSAAWSDSTFSASICDGLPTCTLANVSNVGPFRWKTRGDTLFVTHYFASDYPSPAKTFVRRADGTLLKTDDGQVEVYRRQ
jgi:hypothetical protein